MIVPIGSDIEEMADLNGRSLAVELGGARACAGPPDGRGSRQT
ncbi:MAG: hypothetical protein M5U34_17370 [Chloroflexi bacterium]|nr:hypothetical protein [Chloroflexota bacterium]